MANIDYINALGAGASFDTKSIVESLVQAERAGSEAQIQRKLASAEAKISGLGAASRGRTRDLGSNTSCLEPFPCLALREELASTH